ncbi:MAG: AIR carboxylase family protein [Candidatus Aenigmarchaeota archaeon]|nr:AIR carboxylase family protein [Candidatus Aenigmarchaeota archaeon]
MDRQVVLIMGSKGDLPYADRIADALGKSGYPVIKRIASAHKSPGHLQNVLSQYSDGKVSTLFVTIAGKSDALSGSVASMFPGQVIAAPPDVFPDAANPNPTDHRYSWLDMKEFCSTALPSGAKVYGFAITPQDVAAYVDLAFGETYFSKTEENIAAAERRAGQIMVDDAELQGAEIPLPYTFMRSGKVRDMYDAGSHFKMQSTDRISAFDAVLPQRIEGKGVALTDLSEYWFNLTGDIIPNHLLGRHDERTLDVEKLDIIPVECIVRGYLYGSLWREYESGTRTIYGLTLPEGLQMADKLPEPIFTPTTKASRGHDEPITAKQAMAMGLPQEAIDASLRLYTFYEDHARKRGLIIPDAKMEFGFAMKRGMRELRQGDEPPTHDSARIWAAGFYRRGQKQEGHACDKEFLRQYLLQAGYRGAGVPPTLSELTIRQIGKRCRAAADLITGKEPGIEKYDLLSVDGVLAA